MRIDVVTIFPDYLAPLDLSLPGRARARGLLDLHVHDLRDWAHDRHRTVDDTPYGGGAGMVMRPEPWGEAFDDLLNGGDPAATVVFTSPAGEVLDQALARELATRERLVIACGRYEGIDARVVDHAATLAEVREISLGDYVLNGGEVAALAITEAVVRLLPGFLGNPDSLTEESHESGLLEYPVHTRPATWRGRDVPEVLLGGDHAAIAAWRRQQSVRRTAARRPDLLPPSATGEGWEVAPASPADAGELWSLHLAGVAATASTAATASPEEVRAEVGQQRTYVARSAGRLVGSVRAAPDGEVWRMDRLLLAPDLADEALESLEAALLEAAVAAAPPGVAAYQLVVAEDRERLRRLRGQGFSRARGRARERDTVVLERPVG